MVMWLLIRVRAVSLSSPSSAKPEGATLTPTTNFSVAQPYNQGALAEEADGAATPAGDVDQAELQPAHPARDVDHAELQLGHSVPPPIGRESSQAAAKSV